MSDNSSCGVAFGKVQITDLTIAEDAETNESEKLSEALERLSEEA